MVLHKTLFSGNRPLLRPLMAMMLILVLLLSVASVGAESAGKNDSNDQNRPLDVRVDRLERLMSSQKQLELLYRMKQLQDENQQLRSMLEEQGNEILQLKQQQRELYTDLNRRLNQMEGGDIAVQDTSTAGQLEPAVMTPDTSELPEVIDKTTVKPSSYGVTEREEVIVDDPAAAKPAVATIKPMTAKERKAEQQAYQKAYDELTAKQYTKSRESFIAFIEQFPSGRYAHIAQYWIAEASYAQRNYAQAIKDYQRLLDVYPFSPKKAEAELKKAYSYYELGDKKNARRTLDQLLVNYPNTTESGQAKRLLKKL